MYPAGQLLISAELKEIDGEGGVLGAAGPHTIAQRCPTTSLTGEMIFDEEDIGDIDDAGYLEGVIQHEMGHTIGLGYGGGALIRMPRCRTDAVGKMIGSAWPCLDAPYVPPRTPMWLLRSRLFGKMR